MGTQRAGPTVTIADRYELGDLLGVGGMGQVWEARDVRLRRTVVIKLLKPQLAGDDAVRRRFEIEARAAARLGHPNVVAVFDTGEHDGRPFIVMERLPGPTLAEPLRHGPLDPDEACDVVGDVLAALAAAHAADVVHRDVKPGNVMQAADGRWKVTDFGIATTTGAEPTDPDQVFGTPAYLAPEVLAGAASTPRSDIYSVGVLLHEVLTGRPPGPDGRADARVPPALAAAVARATAGDPAHRFATAEEMAAALGPAEPTRRLAVVPETAPRRRLRPPVVTAVVVAVAVAALATLAVVLSARGTGGAAPDPPPATVAVTDPPATAPPAPDAGDGSGDEDEADERDDDGGDDDRGPPPDRGRRGG